jgi:serine/threonine protein kinase
MSKLKTPIVLQTAYGEYTLHEQIGEGGAGRVYGGVDDEGGRIAVKVLAQAATDKRRRFKNETNFLTGNKHANIVTVTDHGIADVGGVKVPFYVMRHYDGSLREQMRHKLPPDRALKLFSQMLNGVEAAHLQGVTHRDLKPENVLFDKATDTLAIADFGIASFMQQQLITMVETGPTQRLANFIYAAPEQRVSGRHVTTTADIYALGLMLNELYTGEPPLGTDYQPIAAVAKDYAFLDPIVARMIRQNPAERAGSILEVKQLIQQYRMEAVSLQRLSQINHTIIPAGSVDEPLAHEPPSLIDAYWDGGTLHLTLDRPVNAEWVSALQNMGNFTSVMGAGPDRFSFSGTTARVPAQEGSAQIIINHFKAWLPQATRVLRERLEGKMRQQEEQRRENLRIKQEAEERRLRVNRTLRV